MFKEKFDISKVNSRKLVRTIRGSIKKSIFYLDANIPYSISEDFVNISSASIKNYLLNDGKKIKEIVDIDAKIRYCDDILDNKLALQKPRPIKKMHELIAKFIKEVPKAKKVSDLFYLEIEILNNSFTQKELEDKIKSLIEIRPIDFFIIIELLVKKFGTGLDDKTYKLSLDFYKEFQRLRDLMDDIMSVEEDLIKLDYNSIVIAKENNINYKFFNQIVNKKFSNLKSINKQITKHPNKDVFTETINFWEKEYKLLFYRLLVDYYAGLEKFKKSYFLIKQL